MKKKKSLKNQIILFLLFPLMLCIGFLIYYNFYSVHVYNEEVAESSMAMLDLYADNIDGYLKDADKFLTDIAVNNLNFTLLRIHVTQLQAHLALENIKDICKVHIHNGSITGGFFVYSMKNLAYRDVFVQKYEYEQIDKLRSFLMNRVNEEKNYTSLGWFYATIGKKDYFIRIIGDKGTYIMSFIDFNDIPEPVSNRFGDNYTLVYRTKKGEVITNQEFVKEHQIEFNNPTSGYNVTGKGRGYILIGNIIEGTDVEMFLVKSNKGMLGSLKTIQIILFFVSVLSILTIPISLYLIKRTIVKPINQLTAEMEQIKMGDMDTQVAAEYELQEFGEVNDTFNSMISKIKDLKIQSYEQEIEKQKAQMQYLQLQIQPHFFLNCLKNVYGMAENKKYDKIQELVIIISNHLRYIFKNNSKLVLMSEELTYVKNYMQLQEIGMENPPICTIEVETNTMEKMIPPLVIQTFVENSVKYGVVVGRQLVIQIKVKILITEDEEYLDIAICDNGRGYPPNVLEYLEKEDLDTQSDKHIGIYNVIRRLRILYQHKAEFVFTNIDNGAYSELIIPVIKES